MGVVENQRLFAEVLATKALRFFRCYKPLSFSNLREDIGTLKNWTASTLLPIGDG
jgi:hypothetical protein